MAGSTQIGRLLPLLLTYPRLIGRDGCDGGKFLAGLGSAAAWPAMARAQQPPMPVIGFLRSTTAVSFAPLRNEFLKGLGEAGFIEGQNVAIEWRYADNNYEQLPALAADLVRRKVSVLVASGGDSPALAAKATTSNIPIIFSFGGDPVKAGLVNSLSRPGTNATGQTQFTHLLEGKRLGLLHEMLPQAGVIGVLANPSNATANTQLEDLRQTASQLDVKLVLAFANTDNEIDPALTSLVTQRAQAFLILSDPALASRRDRTVAFASRNSIPALYEERLAVAAGGLISYGSDFADGYRQVAFYTGRVLKGEKPADLPVLQPTKFELVINLKTAKTLGLEIPPTLLVRADEVIE
jgi:putative tryptophan/tyrosine transport system substrate-binding protein